MTAHGRMCPLCDASMAVEVCPIHEVPTIATGPSNTPVAKLEVGTVLAGRYRVAGLLSQGGMGALLTAHDNVRHEDVVIKVLKGQRISDLTNVRRFYQEARVVRSLKHPNIVELFEFGVDEATRAPFLAMEVVNGRTLADVVLSEGALAEKRTARIFAQIASALAEAHAKNVLHRDLKPSNIMVVAGDSGSEIVKVLDFGLAKIVQGGEDVPPLTAPGKTVGTPAFMAPEQVTQRVQDFRTDLYGLGCVLHAVLTGAPPFSGPDLIQVMRKQIREPCPPLPDLLSDGHPPTQGLQDLHAHLLKKNRTERPAATDEVARAFGALGEESADERAGRGRGSLVARIQNYATRSHTRKDAPGARVPTQPGEIQERLLREGLSGEIRAVQGEPSLEQDFRDEPTVLANSGQRTPLTELSDPEEEPSATEALAEILRPPPAAATDPGERTVAGAPSPDALATLRPQDTDPMGPRPNRKDDRFDEGWTAVVPHALDSVGMPDTPTPVEVGDDFMTGSVRFGSLPPGPFAFNANVGPLTEPPSLEAGIFSTPPGALLDISDRTPLVQVMESPSPVAPFTPLPPPKKSGRTQVLMTLGVLLAAAGAGVVILAPRAADLGRADASKLAPIAEPPEAGERAPTIIPRAEPVSVRVQSLPPGATVFIDDERLGETPLSVIRPPERANMWVRLEKDGFEAASVPLPREATEPLVVRLQRAERAAPKRPRPEKKDDENQVPVW